MPIKKRQLLCAMRRIVGRIQIQGDQTSPTVQTLAMAFDHRVRQGFGHAKQFFTIHAIFKPRKGRLRSQIFPFDGITTDQEFVHWVARQPCRIVGIFVATGDGHDPLGQQLIDFVTDLSLLAVVLQTSCQRRY